MPLRIVIFSSSTEKIKSISLQAPRDLYGTANPQPLEMLDSRPVSFLLDLDS